MTINGKIIMADFGLASILSHSGITINHWVSNAISIWAGANTL